MEESDNQNGNSKPWLWKKGQSGNIKGRPKGVTLKEYARDFLAKMTDEERDEFMNGLPKEIIWKMAEGNPKQDTEVSGELNEKRTLIFIKDGIQNTTSSQTNDSI